MFLLYLEEFVEMLDVSFLHLLRWNLCLFEMDVLVVKCLRTRRKEVKKKNNNNNMFEKSSLSS